MAINIDAKFKNTETVIIGTKNYDVVFNDKFRKDVYKAMLRAGDMKKQADKISDEEAEKMSLDEQEKYVSDKLADATKIMTDFFDSNFGEGEGKRIYDYYHQDTRMLTLIMGELYKEADKETRQNFKNKKNKYTSNKR
ncbi:MAG: hypothetical protein ABF690_00345 [Liquorilactobacillus nagelii]|uniref:hypothetical protein n=1 Tax=Oenococcus sicerae TaxID=2203724 RepID=UPI0039EBACB7